MIISNFVIFIHFLFFSLTSNDLVYLYLAVSVTRNVPFAEHSLPHFCLNQNLQNLRILRIKIGIKDQFILLACDSKIDQQSFFKFFFQ